MARASDAAAPAPLTRSRLFYGGTVTEAELRQLYALEGVDEEIAYMRKRLKEHIDEHPEAYELMLKSIDSIVRAVSVRYRIGDKRTRDLASAMKSVIDTVGEQFDQVAREAEDAEVEI